MTEPCAHGTSELGKSAGRSGERVGGGNVQSEAAD